MCVAKVSIPGNNRIKNSSGVGLSEDLQRCLAVHSRVTHRKEKPGKLDSGIEIPLHLFDGFADLDNGIKFKIPGGNDNHHFIRGCHSINREPRKGRGAIDKYKVVVMLDEIKLSS